MRLKIISGILTAAIALGQQQPAPQSAEQVRERWNGVFREGASSLRMEANEMLMTALDLRIGQGRNAPFLEEKGWSGVDLSDVAVGEAKKTAAERGLKLDAIVDDLDKFDFGQEQWDLITSFYMHGWQRRSPTDVPKRIYDALKPGGLLVIEGFSDPPRATSGRSCDSWRRRSSRAAFQAGLARLALHHQHGPHCRTPQRFLGSPPDLRSGLWSAMRRTSAAIAPTAATALFSST
jgi:SAM-dependent methyltransferase